LSENAVPWASNGGAGLEGHGRPVEINEAEGREAAQRHAAKAGVAGGTVAHVDRGGLEGAEAEEGQGQGQDALRCGAAGVGFWKDARWHWCPGDETYRPVEPGIFPLVDGLSKRVGRGCDPGVPFDANATAEGRKGRLIGYGNGIVAEVAAEFMRAFMQAAASRVPAIESSHAAGVHKFTEIASSR
jgi:DNA (cytosine-5)-methyltransferase 1